MPRPKRLSVHLVLAPVLILFIAAPAPAAEDEVWPAPPADPVLGLESVLRKLTGFEVAVQGPIETRPRRIQRLKRPSGIALDARERLLVSDAGHGVVLQIDTDLGVALIFGGGTTPRLRDPRGVAPGADGAIYVADAGLGGVVAFDARGEVIDVYGEGWLQEPTDVALSPDGRRLYVADAKADTVGVFELASGHKVETLGGRGSGVGRLHLPLAVEFDPEGNLLVVDQLNARLQLFDTDHFARELELGGGSFTRPRDVAADGAGRLFVTDIAESRIRIFGPDLTALLALGRNGLRPGEFLEIGAIAAKGNRLAVLDRAGGRIQIFRLYGAHEARAAPRQTRAAPAEARRETVDEAPEPLEATRLADPVESADDIPAPRTPSEPSPTAAEAPAEPTGMTTEDAAAKPAPPEVTEESLTAPAPESPVDEARVAQQLLDVLKAWAGAWSARDAEGYLGFYAQSFTPADGSSRQAWSELRRARVSGPSSIDVAIEILQTRIAGERAEVVFLQSYRSDRYSDRVRKMLELVIEDGDWKIERETVLETIE